MKYFCSNLLISKQHSQLKFRNTVSIIQKLFRDPLDNFHFRARSARPFPKKNGFGRAFLVGTFWWLAESLSEKKKIAKEKRALKRTEDWIEATKQGRERAQQEILKMLNSTEAGNIEMELPIIKSKNTGTNKNLIFTLLLIIYAITFLLLKKLKL